ncbi:hypothetical protein EJ07DRAFT_155268 [Lizonia empirigonia]|nr:hypothetical protein EJ07DRAFT_155268 [Lizonia empirigonia]
MLSTYQVHPPPTNNSQTQHVHPVSLASRPRTYISKPPPLLSAHKPTPQHNHNLGSTSPQQHATDPNCNPHATPISQHSQRSSKPSRHHDPAHAPRDSRKARHWKAASGWLETSRTKSDKGTAAHWNSPPSSPQRRQRSAQKLGISNIKDTCAPDAITQHLFLLCTTMSPHVHPSRLGTARHNLRLKRKGISRRFKERRTKRKKKRPG